MAKIAILAGLTKGAVSLALRNNPRIPQATCRRVQEIARRLGYAPSPAVQRAMAEVRRAKEGRFEETLGFLQFRGKAAATASRQSYYELLYAGARDRARELGYGMDEISVNAEGMTTRRLVKILESRNIRGLLVGPLATSFGHIRLPYERFAMVSLSLSLSRPDFHRSLPHQYQHAAIGLRELSRLGYRRIGFAILEPMDRRTGGLFTSAFLNYQRFVPRADRIPVLTGPDDYHKAGFRKWFDRYRPDAILCASMAMAIVLQHYGIRTPEDVGFAALSFPIDYYGKVWDHLAYVNENTREVGAEGVHVLTGLLDRHDFGIPKTAKVTLTTGFWVPGASAPKQSRKRQTTRPVAKPG